MAKKCYRPDCDNNKSSRSWRKKPRKQRIGKRCILVRLNEDFNDPHTDHRSSKKSSARQKTSGDDNSVDKRDRAPPKSPKYSSLSAKAILERAESVLEAINEKGCPTAEENLFNVTVYTADLRLAAATS